MSSSILEIEDNIPSIMSEIHIFWISKVPCDPINIMKNIRFIDDVHATMKMILIIYQLLNYRSILRMF